MHQEIKCMGFTPPQPSIYPSYLTLARTLKVCSQHMNWTDLLQVNPVTRRRFICQRRDFIDCDETRTVSGRLVLNTIPMRYLHWSSVKFSLNSVLLNPTLTRRRYDTRSYFTVRSKADIISQINLPHTEPRSKKWKKKKNNNNNDRLTAFDFLEKKKN